MNTAAPDQNGATTATRVTRVVLIEPNVRLRRVVQKLLELAGFLVWPAPDTESGLAVLRAARWPLLVLLTVSQEGFTHGELRGPLLRAVTTSRTITWPQHTFIIATTSPEYLCAMIDWLPEGLALPVLRQPYDMKQLLRTVALTGYSMESMQRSALRFLPPRRPSATIARPLAPPAWAAEPVAAGVRPSEEDRASTPIDWPPEAATVLAVPLREDVARMRALAQETRNILSHTADVIARSYATHKRLAAAADRWRP